MPDPIIVVQPQITQIQVVQQSATVEVDPQTVQLLTTPQLLQVDVEPQPIQTLQVGIQGPPGRNGQDSSTSFTWQTLSASHQMQSNHAYVLDSPILLLLNLPINPAIGDRIRLIGQGAGGWRITQNADQQVQAGNVATSVGITGRIDSIEPSAQVEIVALSAERWCATTIYGHLDLW
jgi:hypothetical protein